jgi:hypothetical protein
LDKELELDRLLVGHKGPVADGALLEQPRLQRAAWEQTDRAIVEASTQGNEHQQRDGRQEQESDDA